MYPYLLDTANNVKALCMYRGVVATLNAYVQEALTKIDKKEMTRKVEAWLATKAGGA